MPRIDRPASPRVSRARSAAEQPARVTTTPPRSDAAATFLGAGTLSVNDVAVPGPAADAIASRLAALGARAETLRPGVAALYERYDVGERMGRPRERVLTWAAFVDERLRGADTPAALARRLIDDDVRRQLFLLEGILKLYKKDHDELRPHRDAVKALEDAIGAVTGAQAQFEALAGLAAVPDDVKAHLRARLEDAEEALVAVVAQGWFPDRDGKVPAMAGLVGTLEGLYFGSDKQDRSFLADELRDELKEIRDTAYDMADLQGEVGMHELRRDLRWFPIYVESLDGLVQLSEAQNPLPSYEGLLDDELARSKFVKLPPADLDKHPMTLSLSLYTAVMEQVLGLGALKDERETIEGLADALVAVGRAEPGDDAVQAASEMLGRDADADAELTAEAERRYRELTERGLIQALRKELKRYE